MEEPVQNTPPTGPEGARPARARAAALRTRIVLRTRIASAAALVVAGLAMAVPASAQAPAPEIPVTFSVRSLLSGDAFTASGVLPGGAANAGRPLELYEQRAPFPGAYALTSTGAAGPSGEFV